MKNESQKLAPIPAPNEKVAPSARNWLPSRRSSWLPFKPDASTDAKNAIAQERENLIRDLSLLNTAHESEIQAKTQAFEALAKEQQHRAQAEDERMALSQQLRQAQDDLGSFGLTNKTLEKDAKELAQEKQSLSQEIAALNTSLALEAKAKAQAAEQLAQETSARKQVDEQAALLLTQLHQVQEELERFYLSNKALEKDARAIAQTQRELEAKAKTKIEALQTTFAQEKATLTQEKQTLAQEKTKAIAARDAEAKAKTEALAKGELEAKANTEAQLKLEAETKAKTALQKEKAALAQDKLTLSQEITAVKASLATEAKAKAQAAEQLAHEISLRKQADEEGALLLAQLHQVQEELERYYLNSKDLEKEAKALAQTQHGLQAKAKAEIEALQASYAKEKAALTQENQALAQEKAEAIAARDAEAKAKIEAQSKLEAEAKANTALQNERDVLAQNKQSLSQEIAVLKASLETNAKAKAQAAEQLARETYLRAQAEEEGALLLAQLHQVLDELERYYLNNKDLQTSLRHAQTRFGSVLSRQPDGMDWETVRIQPLMLDGKPALQCKAANVAVMGKEWKTLDFLAFKHDGVLSFSFERSEDAPVAGPLTRWPRAAAALPALAVRVGQDAYDESNMATLKDLSTSDWHMLRGLPRLVAQGLQSAAGPWPAEQPDIAEWQAAAQATPPAINDLPIALRYDAFNVHGAANLSGYENLQIQLSHLDLGQKRFENFEFRFACNLSMQGEFGLNARLEFFKLSGRPVFEQWAPNYRDGQQERLDLVFVFPSTLNLKEFSALSTNDRALVLLLADRLPALLTDLSPNGLALNRPLKEWTALAQKLRNFVRARLDVMGVQKQPGALVDAAFQYSPTQESDTPNPSKRRSAPHGVKSVPLPLAEAEPKEEPMPLKRRQK